MQNLNLLAAIVAMMSSNAVVRPESALRPQKHRAKDANSGGNRTARGAHKRAHRAALKARRG